MQAHLRGSSREHVPSITPRRWQVKIRGDLLSEQIIKVGIKIHCTQFAWCHVYMERAFKFDPHTWHSENLDSGFSNRNFPWHQSNYENELYKFETMKLGPAEPPNLSVDLIFKDDICFCQYCKEDNRTILADSVFCVHTSSSPISTKLVVSFKRNFSNSLQRKIALYLTL